MDIEARSFARGATIALVVGASLAEPNALAGQAKRPYSVEDLFTVIALVITVAALTAAFIRDPTVTSLVLAMPAALFGIPAIYVTIARALRGKR